LRGVHPGFQFAPITAPNFTLDAPSSVVYNRYVNRYISIYTYYMLFERQGWAKSTGKNVAKPYLDIQITANHYTTYYANN
jgi:hypothetical protein